MTRKTHKPIIGAAFHSEQTNLEGNISNYLRGLEYYGPRRFHKLIKDGRAILADLENDLDDAGQFAYEWQNDCDTALTEFARAALRHDYVYFGPESGSVGFWYAIDSALNDADLTSVDYKAEQEIPRGFSGLFIHINDHGNVTAWRYSRGRGRVLFAAV